MQLILSSNFWNILCKTRASLDWAIIIWISFAFILTAENKKLSETANKVDWNVRQVST